MAYPPIISPVLVFCTRTGLLLAGLQKLCQVVCRLSQGTRQTELRDVVCEHAIDVVQLRACDGLLGLDNLNVVGHPGLIPLAGQVKIFGSAQESDETQAGVSFMGSAISVH